MCTTRLGKLKIKLPTMAKKKKLDKCLAKLSRLMADEAGLTTRKKG